MENFNRVLSFVLGLVVVIVFVIVLSGRLNLKSGIFGAQNKKITVTATPTPTPAEAKRGFFSRLFAKKPTPTPTISVQPTPVVVDENGVVVTPTPTSVTVANGQTKGGVTSNVKEIPATGLPSAMLPLLGSSALLGVYLRKRK